MGEASLQSCWSPLKGTHVLDFSAQLPGPMATSILADLGAEVIKVEPPGGEFGRQIPAGMFERVNRGKRSLPVDLKAPAAQSIVHRLSAWADVVVESFRPGVGKRLMIDADSLRSTNPRIVYCSLSGYGQVGPWRNRPGHDLSFLAASGALGLPGEWAQPPHRSSLPIADIAGGSFAISAILAALLERERTGKGCHIDLSLFDSALYCTGIRTAFNEENCLGEHLFPTQGLFETSDGVRVAVAIVEQHFWEQFLEVTGDLAPELLRPEYTTAAGRFRQGDELHERLRCLFRSRTASEWKALLEGSELPVEICLSPLQAGRSEHVTSRQTLTEHDGRKFCSFPVIVDGHRKPRKDACSAPKLGAESLTILKELGFRHEEAVAYAQSGVIGQARG